MPPRRVALEPRRHKQLADCESDDRRRRREEARRLSRHHERQGWCHHEQPGLGSLGQDVPQQPDTGRNVIPAQ